MTTTILPGAAANSAASRNKECEVSMPGYAHETATVQDAREYADCVRLLYPAPSAGMPGGGTLVVKLAILFVLAYGAGFAWKDRQENRGDLGMYFLSFAVGVLAGAACLVILALVAVGVGFLFFA